MTPADRAREALDRFERWAEEDYVEQGRSALFLQDRRVVIAAAKRGIEVSA